MSNESDTPGTGAGAQLLTPRDCKAINLLLDKQISALRDNPREGELWRQTTRRFNGDVSAKPGSLAPGICELVNAARSFNLTEVDRIGTTLVKKLYEHGDMEGSAALSRVLNQPYEKPDLVPRKRGGRSDPYVAAPSGPSSPSMSPSGSTNSSNANALIPKPASITNRPENQNIAWYEPHDMGEEMVLDDLCGPPLTRLIEELKIRSVLLGAGVDAPTRALFHGPPGTGKTLAARYVGGAIGKAVAAAKIGSMMSAYLSGTTTNLMKVIQDAAQEDAIIFLDEIETVAGNRAEGMNVHEEYKRATGALLQALDQLPPHIIVIAATNFPDKIDKALRSRLAFEVAFKYPDKQARSEQIKRHLKVEAKVDAVSYLLAATEGKSGRFIRAVVMAANRAAIMAAPKIGDKPDITKAIMTIEHVSPAVQQTIEAEKMAAKTEDEMRKR